MAKPNVKCLQCGKHFYKKPINIKLYPQHFCSRNCFNKYIKGPDCFCLNCGKQLLKKDQKKFCSKSCSATYNNQLRDKSVYDKVIRSRGETRQTEHTKKLKKRKSLNRCKNCGTQIWPESTYCTSCKDHLVRIQYLERTLKEVTNKDTVKYWQQVRTNARSMMKHEYKKEPKCAVCGYKTYVEVCHIKPIKEFEKTAKIKEINSKDNLVYLCPNHHKELDLGLIKL